MDVRGAAPAERATTTDDAIPDFAELYRRWWSDVVALCRRMLGRVAEAEDIAQEAFLRAWLARDQYSPSEPYWPWLATIARRLCLDSLRRSGRAASDEAGGQALAVDVVEVSPERIVLAAEELQVVLRAVDRLRGRDRRALLLRELGGWPYQRIAAVEGMTVEAVRGSLKRARATLRRAALHEDVFDAVPRSVFDALRADDQNEQACPPLSHGSLARR